MEELMQKIANLLKQSIQEVLMTPRPSLTYNGIPKPVSGKFPTPISPPISSRGPGSLYNSVNVFWETDFEDGEPNLVVEMNDYYFWVDQGRKPTRGYKEVKVEGQKTRYIGLPPLSDILKWVIQKPALSSPKLSDKQRAFLAARSIAKYGYYPTDFLIKAEDRVINQLVSESENAALKYFEKLIDEGRIFPRDLIVE